MTYSEIQDQIVSNFWSEGLKKHIRDTGYVFPPEKLLCIAYKQTPNFTERLERMKLFADHVPGAADHARLVIAWMEGCLEAFRASGEHTIFEVRIAPDGDDDTLDYVCADFDTCLDTVRQFYATHPRFPESKNARAAIIKRRFLQSGDPIDLHWEEYGELGPGRVITHIPTGMTCEYGECDGDCRECPHPCVDCTEDLIPEWIPDLSPVRYLDISGAVCFGCILTDGSDAWDAYTIPLDSEMLREDLEKAWDFLDHEHIPWPNVDAIAPDELDVDLRRNYDAFVSFWKRQYPDKYSK